ncbi:hypothetical protein U9M48_035956 [Paspalum notatum var. saurae]|uniref:Uncharacterized protein n=1 Tax=Paspalum notatum var. saurae TaxID=547442 RepID=A0AAQ3UE69_PASNO
MVVPSLNRPRQATPGPLPVLALLEDEQKFKLGGVLTVVPKMHIKQLKTCQESKMGLTGQNGQVGRPRAWSPDPPAGSADPEPGRLATQSTHLPLH